MTTTLPNGLRVFNGTPHPITFWAEHWQEPVTVPVDEIISASSQQQTVGFVPGKAQLDRILFLPTESGYQIINRAFANNAEVVIGSVIAAQAYPGTVVAMIPARGYERVPPEQKRMKPDEFAVF